MFLPKSKTGYLLLAALCCLLVSSAALAVDQEDGGEPTAENLWKAKQNKDLKEAERIRAILEQEAQKFWRSPANDDFPPELMPVSPPQKFEPVLKSFNWGNDATIAAGSMEGGISADYCSDSLYAVRCTTYNGVDKARMNIYKSTDEGATWSYLSGLVTTTSQFSYPVILTGNSGTPDRLYLFYLRASQNGEIRVARYTQGGTWEGTYLVKSDSDTISYYSACTNYGLGSRLMVAYQRNPMASATPDLYTIVSSDYGESWGGQVYISGDGSHPDIAYGRQKHVYLTYEKTSGSDDEIHFGRSTDYCASGSWEYFQSLTSDSWDDNYPKVAALHTTPEATPHIWVAYNHDFAGSGNIDLRFAYSTNGGDDWSKNHVLANELDYNEMACDLWVGRNSSFTYVNICYLAYRGVSYLQRWYDIRFGIANTGAPSLWQYVETINDQWGAWDHDGRKVCQGTYGDIASYASGVVFAGHTLDINYFGLYFDHRGWTDVEDEITEERLPGEFSLLDNYPNPFNPETQIKYTVQNSRGIPVTIEVYNVLGQLVRVLVNEPKERGTYQVTWDGRDQNGDQTASGVYFYKLEAGDFSQTKKMVLIR